MAQDVARLLYDISECHGACRELEKKQQTALIKQFIALFKVADAFERVFANIEARKEACTPQMNIWLNNFRSIYKQLRRLLSDQGVFPSRRLPNRPASSR